MRNKPYFRGAPSLCSSETKAEAIIDLIMFLYYYANESHYHQKGFTLGFVLKLRVFGTRKWPMAKVTFIKSGKYI